MVGDITVPGRPDTTMAFTTYAVPTDLPSFPTRRSSDLLKAGQSTNFETEPSIAVKVTATDTTGDAFSVNTTVDGAVTGVNSAQFCIASTILHSVDENTAVETRGADIAVAGEPDTTAAFS